jgi:hypothetical protein
MIISELACGKQASQPAGRQAAICYQKIKYKQMKNPIRSSNGVFTNFLSL